MFLPPLINESESRTEGNLVYVEDVFHSALSIPLN